MLNNLFQAITKKKNLIEEKADCIYQNRKEQMKNTYILLQKKIKERDASKNSSKLKENNLILQKKLSINEFQKNDFKDKDMKSI